MAYKYKPVSSLPCQLPFCVMTRYTPSHRNPNHRIHRALRLDAAPGVGLSMLQTLRANGDGLLP